MARSFRQWGAGMLLGSLVLLGGGEGPLPVLVMAQTSSRDSDSFQFQEELRSQGAYKFYDETEAILRSGNFELALGRYLFLASAIRGQPIYAGLNTAVNHRLHFLRTQMGLREEHLRTAARRKRKVKRVSQAKPAAAEKKAPSEAKPEGEAPGKPEEVIIPPTVTPDQKTAPPGPEAKPSPPEVKPAQPEVKPDAPGPTEEKPPSPPPSPPSLWEKLKRRLKFW